jgi:hypothetical protein
MSTAPSKLACTTETINDLPYPSPIARDRNTGRPYEALIRGAQSVTIADAYAQRIQLPRLTLPVGSEIDEDSVFP